MNKRKARRQNRVDVERSRIARAAQLRGQINFELAKLKREKGEDFMSAEFSKLMEPSSIEALVDILVEKKVVDRTTFNIRRYEKLLLRLRPEDAQSTEAAAS